MSDEINHIASTQRPVRIEREVVLSTAALGITSIVTQIILLREFLSVFYGNELVIGIILANWMALTGAGSFVGKYADRVKGKMTFIILSLCLMAILPSVTVFLLRYLRNIVFSVGSMVGIFQILYSSFLLLMPYCLLTGFLFTFLAHVVSEGRQSTPIPVIYSLEAVGSIIGGLLFNLVMMYFLKTFQSLFLLMLFDLAIAFILSLKYGNLLLKLRVAFLFVACCVTAVSFDFDKMSKGFLFKDQDVLYYKDTPYGNLTVTKQADQKNFYENNVLLFSTNDVVQNEEAVHYAMLQHPHPANVLLISGGIAGTTLEILKYNVDRIDYVELNPWILEIGRNYTAALADRRIHVVNEDARLYVKETAQHYDVVLINVPDPGTTQINRFFTVEFLHLLKAKLNEGAVVSFSLLPAEEYVSDKARQINSIMANTLKTEFRNVLIVPGMKNYFLASDNKLDIHISRLAEQRRLDNTYVNQYYLDDRILQERSDYIAGGLSGNAPLNTDFTPVSYYEQVQYWLSYFKVKPWIWGALCAVGLAVVGVKLNPITFGVFTGGFAASSAEVLLLVGFQILYGYVYQIIGLIVTVFMAGLALGSFYVHKKSEKSSISGYIRVQFGIGISSALLPVVFIILQGITASTFLIHAIFFLLTFVIAGLIGIEFAVASRMQRGKTASVASELYGVDLIGSAIGALAVTAYLIPMLGVIRVGLLVALLSIVSGVVTLVNRRKYVPMPT
ncbi:MAG: fused MFS/spermidine synthase [Bacteroidota bacterium]